MAKAASTAEDYAMSDDEAVGFYIDTLSPMEDGPDRDLLLAMGDKARTYDFSFYQAQVCRSEDEMPTSSYIEVAYSRQLGGAYVVWFSGVSALEAVRSCSYGWIQCAGVDKLDDAIDDALFKGSLLKGVVIHGFHRNPQDYYSALPPRP